MTSIGIYMEGGGDKRNGRALLRQGMDEFLSTAKRHFRDLHWNWKLSCWGSREATYRRFRDAIKHNEHRLTLLLVDAEGPVSSRPAKHLADREVSWDTDFAPESSFHLMVQTMETWLVADSTTLADYYGKGFRGTALLRHHDLESEPKQSVERALKRATENTQKGEYHKIRHASSLLKRLDANQVRSKCPHCERLFHTLEVFLLKTELAS